MFNIHTTTLPITTLQYLSPLANFLFTEDHCKKFSTLLNNHKNISYIYNKLWNCYLDQLKQYSKTIDKIIFESEINAIFGFSFFNSVFKTIEQIHNTSVSKEKNLKDLEGQLFNNIILQSARLPLFFNKELFLKYACIAFLYAPQIDYSYFEQSAKYGMFRIDSSASKEQQVIVCLDLMRKFFQILYSVTIPVLYSLWEVVIYELRQKKLPLSLNMDIYINYLSNNYDCINYSYNFIPDSIISEWGTPHFTSKNFLNNRILLDYIKKNPYEYNKTTDSQHKVIDSIFPTICSNYSLEVIEQLIQSYCSMNSLKEFCFPFFFLTNEGLISYSPLSKLIESFLYDNRDSKMPIGKENFLIKYKNNLFEYLFSKE